MIWATHSKVTLRFSWLASFPLLISIATCSASDQGKLYWSLFTDTVIYRSSFDGSEIEALIRTDGGAPLDVALDAAGGKMYWSSPAGGGIQRANLDGSSVELVLPIDGTPHLVAFDEQDRNLYWVKRDGDNVISQFDLATGQSTLVVPTTETTVVDALEVDSQGEYLYWIDRLPSTVRRTRLDDFSTEVILDDADVGGPFLGTSLALTDDSLYVANDFDDSILRVDLDDFELSSRIADSVVDPIALAFSTTTERLYWANRWPVGGIWSSTLDGGDIQKVVETFGVGTSQAEHIAILEAVVPEPGSLVLVLFGAALWVWASARRQGKFFNVDS